MYDFLKNKQTAELCEKRNVCGIKLTGYSAAPAN